MTDAAASLSARVIVIPAAGPASARETRASGAGLSGVLAAAASLLAAVILFAHALALNAAQASWALKTFPFWWGGESEAGRLFDKGWPAFEAVEAIAELAPADEKVLVFRQAEIAFYTRVNYVFFFDTAISPIFIMKDPAAASAALAEKGVRWIAAPDYAMPEIDNSAIGAIIADPGLATLVREFGGFRLFRLKEAPDPAPASPAGGEIFTAGTPAAETWRAATMSGGSPGKGRVAAAPDGRLEIMTPHSLFGAAGEALQLERWRPPDPETAAFFVDLSPGAAVVDISADLEGRGRAEIVVQTIRNAAAGDADATPAPPPETPVWRGVLLGERRTVSGQFLAPVSDRGDPALIGYRLAIRLKGPGRLVFGGWRADAVAPPTSGRAGTVAAAAGAKDRASAWAVEWAAAGSAAAGLLRDDGAGGAALALAPRETVRLSGPWLVEGGLAARLRGAAAGPGPDDGAIAALAETLGVLPYEIAARVTLAGRGVAGLRIFARCAEGGAHVSALEPVRPAAGAADYTIRTRLKCRPALARVGLVIHGPSAGDSDEASEFRVGAPRIGLIVPGAEGETDFVPAAAIGPEFAATLAAGGN